MTVRSGPFGFLLGLALLCSNTCVVSAASEYRGLTLSGFGSYQTYDMSDVNQAMQDALASFPPAQAGKDEIQDAVGFGAEIRVWPNERTFVSLGYQRLPASNSGSGQYLGSTYTVDLGVPANGFTLGAGYVLTPESRFRFGLAGGVGFYVTSGEIKTTGPGVNDETEIEGSGFGGHGLALMLTRLTPKLDIEVDAGYRYAKTTDVTGNGDRIENADGSPAKIDWSGFTSSVGLTFWAAGR